LVRLLAERPPVRTLMPGCAAFSTARHDGSSRLLQSQGFEDLAPGPPAHGPAEPLLLLRDGGPAATADQAVHLADVVAAPDQQLLELAPFRATDARIVGRPWRMEGRAAPEPVREM